MITTCKYFIPNNDTGGTGKCTKLNRWCATWLAKLEDDVSRECDLEGVHIRKINFEKETIETVKVV